MISVHLVVVHLFEEGTAIPIKEFKTTFKPFNIGETILIKDNNEKYEVISIETSIGYNSIDYSYYIKPL